MDTSAKELKETDSPVETFREMKRLYDAMKNLYDEMSGFMGNFCSHCGKPYSDGCDNCGD